VSGAVAPPPVFDGFLTGVMEAMATDDTIFLLHPGSQDSWQDLRLGSLPDGSFPDRSMRGGPGAIVAAAAGAALAGLRPVVELEAPDLLLGAAEELTQQVAAARKAWQIPIPLILAVADVPPADRVAGAALALLWGVAPPVRIAAPSCGQDAQQLARRALEADDPSIFLLATWADGQAHFEPDATPAEFGAAVKRARGDDVTVVAYGALVGAAVAAALRLEQEAIGVEVIDLRTLWPIDVDAISASVRRTNRLVVVTTMEQDPFAAELIAAVGLAAFDYLDAPIQRAVCSTFGPGWSGMAQDAIADSARSVVRD
jgi:pyruvate/2-oxoglutarate/acetoin dehydrogenase E1 component